MKKTKGVKLDAVRFALAGGIVSAICIGLMTIAGIYEYFGAFLILVKSIYGL